MSGSQSYHSLQEGVGEVRELISIASQQRRASWSERRVIGRASLVLLYSHLERYIYDVNLESTDFLNQAGVKSDDFTEEMKLLLTRYAVDEMAVTQWNRRRRQLEEFVEKDVWVWSTGTKGEIDGHRLLAWMRSAKPESLVRYFRYWGINDIFEHITRIKHHKAELRRSLEGLAAKRNNIAHGDLSEDASPSDVRGYSNAVNTFCSRVDKALARLITKFVGTRPW